MEKYGQLSQNANKFGRAHQTDSGVGDRHWLVANYEAGDVVFHDPYIVHSSSNNEGHDGRIRISTDFGFYEEESDMDDCRMQLWTPGDGL
jgi:phytanoyl-CoA hydroxylase